MNSLVAKTILERQDIPSATTDGVYADFSKGQDRPEYYAQCPECRHVHGMYPSLATAVSKKLCGGCQFDRVQTVKRELEKMRHPKPLKPGQKRKLPWPLSVREDLDPTAGDGEGVPDPKQELARLLPTKTFTFKGNDMINAYGMVSLAQRDWQMTRGTLKQKLRKCKYWYDVIHAWQGRSEEEYLAFLDGKADVVHDVNDAKITLHAF